MRHGVEGLALVYTQNRTGYIIRFTVRNHFDYIHEYLLNVSILCKTLLGPRKDVTLIFFSLLLRALDITLYRQLKSEIGLQVFILEVSPFFGINLIDAVLKL
jgi:hypothetical protein